MTETNVNLTNEIQIICGVIAASDTAARDTYPDCAK